MRYLGTLNKTKRMMRAPTLARKKARKTPVRIGAKRLHSMSGGPATSLWLHSSGTLTFRIGKFFGHYDTENKWVEI